MDFDGEVLRGKFNVFIKYHDGHAEKYTNIVEIRNEIDRTGIVHSYILTGANAEAMSINYRYVMHLTIKENKEQ